MVRDEESTVIERTVSANGFDFRVHEAGSGDRLALCLHGFPELGYSWRHQLPLLADLGYRAWAPDLRGYGATRPRPRRRRDYLTPLLVDDVAALIDAADPSETVLIGHDWGAALAWTLAIQQVRPLDRLVIMNVPHPARLQRQLRTFGQLRKSWYIFFFQLPWLPEYALGRNGAQAVGEAFSAMAVNPERFDDEVLDVYRRAASQPGALRAMVNWYRGAVLSLRSTWRSTDPVIETPTLMVWGEQDTALGKELAEGTDEYVSDLTLRYVPDASHWVQQDQPDVVNAMLQAFLTRQPVPERADLP
ncbi:alpha/beta fold hydrolase [Ilumatobacter sp.]|uniref:alpha/beta fold hydrolase n=1 Tax=Ilumatobacter sp. TaxID=1967498 RepID=UPI003C705FB4